MTTRRMGIVLMAMMAVLISICILVVSCSAQVASLPAASDPANDRVSFLKPNDLNGYGHQKDDDLRPQDMGNNPVDDNYRRGSFGPRRRRVPYGDEDARLRSVNPFHQFNNARNLPMDVFRPRQGEVDDLAHQKRLADYARQSRAFSLPYGGYSSFRNHVFRRATADPLFRMNLHRSVDGREDPHNPMGVGLERPETSLLHGGADGGSDGSRGVGAGNGNGNGHAHGGVGGVGGLPVPPSFPFGPASPPFVSHAGYYWPNLLSDGTPYVHPGTVAYEHARATPYGSVLDGTNPFALAHNGGSYNPYLAGYYGYGAAATNPYAAGMAGVSPYAVPNVYAGAPVFGYGHPAVPGAMAPGAEMEALRQAQARGFGSAPHAYAYDPLHWHHHPLAQWHTAAQQAAEQAAKGLVFHREGNQHQRANHGSLPRNQQEGEGAPPQPTPNDQATTAQEVKDLESNKSQLDDKTETSS